MKRYIILVIASLSASLIYAGTYHVPSGKYPTIQSAVDASTPGDTIIVSPGTYNERVEFKGKNITLRSEDPTSESIVKNTIITGENIRRTVLFQGDEESSAVLSGFSIIKSRAGSGSYAINGNQCKATIINNIITEYVYGIIYCAGLIENNQISGGYVSGISDCNGIIKNNTVSQNTYIGIEYCNGTIENNLISKNRAGGLYHCNGLIQNNIVTENYVRDDNGAGFFGCDGVIKNNIIIYNTAVENAWGTGLGGAFYGCNGQISNNLIQDNVAENGAGFYNCNALIKNNRVIDNDGNALNFCNSLVVNNVIVDIIHTLTDLGSSNLINNTIFKEPTFYHGTGIIKNNIILWKDGYNGTIIDGCQNVTYNCLPHSYPGVGNIIADPMFNDVSKYDFRLKAGSPCIDAGDPALEYNDACSPPGLGGIRNDMGAYGGPGNNGWPLVVDDYWIKNFILKAYYPSDDFKLKLDINNDSVIDSSDIIEYVNQPKKEN